MKNLSPCPNCGSRELYRSKEVSAGGRHAPDYLPGLGSFLLAEKFHLVACRDCGFVRFFARPEAMAKLSESKKWTRL
jgi:predicted nucleic-acid-binding Zn-ribbon protein